MSGIELKEPVQVGSLRGKAEATFCGITQKQAEFTYGLLALTGHAFLGISGKFSGSGWLMATGALWVSNSIALMVWPGKAATMKYVAVTVILGSATLAVDALHKEHYAGQLTFCALAVTRNALLLCDEKRFPNSTKWRFICRNRKEINGSVGFPSRVGLLVDGILNHEYLVAGAAILYQICDLNMIISGRAQKRTAALKAAAQERGGR